MCLSASGNNSTTNHSSPPPDNNNGDNQNNNNEEVDEERLPEHDYRLVSVVSHYGATTSSGHYVADVYR